MSSIDAMIHAAYDLIHPLQNPAPVSPIVTIINAHKGALIYLAYIFRKESPLVVPLRVPVRGHTKKNSNR